MDARHDDVAALHQAHAAGRFDVEFVIEQTLDPRAGGIHQNARAHFAFLAARLVAQCHAPGIALAPRAAAARACEHGRAMRARRGQGQHHQARVVHPGIAISKTAGELRLQAGAMAIGREPDAARFGQAAATAHMVIEEQSGTDHPCRAQMPFVRQHEFQRPDDVRRDAQHHLALGQRLRHQAKLVVFEVAQPAVNQLGAGRGGCRGEIVLLGEQHLEAATGGIARDARAVDAAADDGDVVEFH